MTLARPRTFDSVIVPLTSTLRDWRILNPSRYNSATPDTFNFAGLFSPENDASLEPPNAVRKALFEIKFDTVQSNAGTIELDSLRFVVWNGQKNVIYSTVFVGTWDKGDIPVNFVKSIITVAPPPPPPPPCDISRDGVLSATDVVWAMNCIFTGAVVLHLKSAQV